jgi:hypothetical protein
MDKPFIVPNIFHDACQYVVDNKVSACSGLMNAGDYASYTRDVSYNLFKEYFRPDGVSNERSDFCYWWVKPWRHILDESIYDEENEARLLALCFMHHIALDILQSGGDNEASAVPTA